MRITQIPLLAVLALAPLTAFAQAPVLPSSVLVFDHDGVDTETYELRVDGGAWATATVAPMTGAPETFVLDMPALTPGEHAIELRACGAAGCSEPSAPFVVRLVLVPAVPGNLRIVTPEVQP